MTHILRSLTVILLASIGICDKVTSSAAADHNPAWEAVDKTVLIQLETIGPQHILLLGDSLIHMNPFTSICGWPVINAGYSGATWQDVGSRPILEQLHSRVAIVMLGTNNALQVRGVTAAEIGQVLRRLPVEQLVLATPPPVQRPRATQAILKTLAEVQALLKAQPYKWIDTGSLTEPSYYVEDGVHLTLNGYSALKTLIEGDICR